MANCPICGAPHDGLRKFCSSCGASLGIDTPPVQPPQSPQPQTQQQVVQAQQTQVYAPYEPKKSKTPLIIGIVVAVIVIVIVLALVMVFMFTGGGLSGDESKLVGTWESSYGIIEYKFNSDGSLEIGSLGHYSDVGTWNVEGNKLCWDYSTSYGGTDICYDYTISGNQLTLSSSGYDVWILTKK